MAIQIQLRNDTSANWTSANPILAQGEIGLETNTRLYKIGNGTTAWNSLAYGSLVGTINVSAVVTTVKDIAAAYTILAADENTFIRSTSSSAITITIANVLNPGESIQFVQWGTGQLTFAAGAGVTLGSPDNKLKTSKQYSAAAVTCLASGLYLVTGDVTA
jgi:hypothetical protein